MSLSQLCVAFLALAVWSPVLHAAQPSTQDGLQLLHKMADGLGGLPRTSAGVSVSDPDRPAPSEMHA